MITPDEAMKQYGPPKYSENAAKVKVEIYIDSRLKFYHDEATSSIDIYLLRLTELFEDYKYHRSYYNTIITKVRNLYLKYWDIQTYKVFTGDDCLRFTRPSTNKTKHVSLWERFTRWINEYANRKD